MVILYLLRPLRLNYARSSCHIDGLHTGRTKSRIPSDLYVTQVLVRAHSIRFRGVKVRPIDGVGLLFTRIRVSAIGNRLGPFAEVKTLEGERHVPNAEGVPHGHTDR